MSYVRKTPAPVDEADALRLDAARFWSRVEVGAKRDCWTWKGCRKPNGRGQYSPMNFKGKIVGGGRQCEQAHVWAWVLTHGSRPLGHGLARGSAGIVLRHTCGNGALGCVNPHHLRPGTQGDNNRETSAAGRFVHQQLKAALERIKELEAPREA